MRDKILERHAPHLADAVARKSGHPDVATRALVAARALTDRVNRLQLSGDEIVAEVAETIYCLLSNERSEWPERERTAVKAALSGIEPALVAAVRRVTSNG